MSLTFNVPYEPESNNLNNSSILTPVLLSYEDIKEIALTQILFEE